MANPNELVLVVDLTNKPLSLKLREELTHDDTWRIICVWIENDKGQVLLQQRSFNKKHGAGKWTCAVEGTVEGKDAYLETAIREVEEEIGLPNVKLKPTKLMFYETAGHGKRFAQGYTAVCNWPLEKFVIQKEEVEQLKWADKEEVIKGIMDGGAEYPLTSKVWLEMFDLHLQSKSLK